MTKTQFMARVHAEAKRAIPFPAEGETAVRLDRLAAIAREDLSLARIMEAHYDAMAILHEAGKMPQPGALYAVWASEPPGSPVCLDTSGVFLTLKGRKPFCSGSGIADRALVSVNSPKRLLVDLDLQINLENIEFDDSQWQTDAFANTQTSTATFRDCIVSSDELVGAAEWYLDRPGFWHGALAPAACWAGGAMGLVDYALTQSRQDPHTMAHLGALQACDWALRTYLKAAGDEIDLTPNDAAKAKIRALTVRHRIEQTCSEVLERFGRAYGPYPLSMNLETVRRCQELTLYLRQCHAERDLETLGSEVRASLPASVQV